MKKLYKKLADFKNKIHFLSQCIRHELTPNYIKHMNRIHINTTHYNYQNKKRLENTINSHSIKIIKIELKNSYSQINIIQSRIDKEWYKINREITQREFTHINKIIKTIYQKHYAQKRKTINKKLERLRNTSNSLLQRYINNKNKYLINLSDRQIPKNVSRLLNMGPKMAINQETEKDTLKLITDVEQCIGMIRNPEHKKQIRAASGKIIKSHIGRLKNKRESRVHQQIKQDLKQTKKFKKQNKDIIFLEADKTNNMVIMNKAEYEQGMNEILNDKTKYQKLGPERKHLHKIERKISNHLDKLVKCNTLTKEQSKTLKVEAPVPGQMYGVVKTHKPQNPIRPIITSTSTANRNVSKYLANIIKTVVKHDHRIKNSVECKERLKDLKIEDNEVQVSLDIKELYPSLPLPLIKCILSEKWDLMKDVTELNKDEFIKTFEICMDSNIFMYDNNFYMQVGGTPIGNPISGILADLLIDHIYEEVIAKYEPKILMLYVDDSYCILKKEKLIPLLEDLNKFHPNIVYTHEIETEKRINFLDVTIIRRDNGSISTNIYKKQTKTNRSINFLSRHPPHQKKNIIKNEVRRICKLSEEEFIEENLRELKEKYMENMYPESYIEKMVHDARYEEQRDRNSEEERRQEKNPPKYLGMNYIPCVSEQIQRLIKKFNIKLALRPEKPLKELINNKSQIDKLDMSSIVYEIPCKTCSEKENKKSVYIGQTKRRLHIRLREHFNSCIHHPTSSALAIHASEHQHEFSFEETRILARENNTKKREFLESYFIMKDRQTINFKRDKEQWSLLYSDILTSLK